MLRIGSVLDLAQRRLPRGGISSLSVAILLSLAAAQLASGQDARGFTIVVNESHPMSALSLQEVGEVFRKELLSLDGGIPIVPIDLPVTSPIRESFSMVVHGRPGAAIDAFWRRQAAVSAQPMPRERTTRSSTSVRKASRVTRKLSTGVQTRPALQFSEVSCSSSSTP